MRSLLVMALVVLGKHSGRHAFQVHLAELGYAMEGAELAKAFDRLKGLVGTWTSPLPDGQTIRLAYRLIANDTVLVETQTSPSGRETLTLFHLDGTRVVATHYCAQGNQPRLRLSSKPDATPLVFDFHDATNLQPKVAYLKRLEWTVGTDGTATKLEVYREGQADVPSRLDLTRISK